MQITMEQLAMSNAEFDDQLRHEIWIKNNKAGHGRQISEAEAIETFKDDLYPVCMGKIGMEDQPDTFRSLLIKLRNHRRGDLDVERARRYPIVDLIAKMGFQARHNKLNCMFHEDKTASFSISPQKNLWHCFGCSTGGGTIDFIMRHQGLKFVQAVKYLMNA